MVQHWQYALALPNLLILCKFFQPNVATEFHPGEFGEFQLHLSRKVWSQWHSKLGAQSHSNRLAKSRPVLLQCYSQRHFLYPKDKPKQYRVLAILFHQFGFGITTHQNSNIFCSQCLIFRFAFIQKNNRIFSRTF